MHLRSLSPAWRELTPLPGLPPASSQPSSTSSNEAPSHTRSTSPSDAHTGPPSCITSNTQAKAGAASHPRGQAQNGSTAGAPPSSETRAGGKHDVLESTVLLSGQDLRNPCLERLRSNVIVRQELLKVGHTRDPIGFPADDPVAEVFDLRLKRSQGFSNSPLQLLQSCYLFRREVQLPSVFQSQLYVFSESRPKAVYAKAAAPSSALGCQRIPPPSHGQKKGQSEDPLGPEHDSAFLDPVVKVSHSILHPLQTALYGNRCSCSPGR